MNKSYKIIIYTSDNCSFCRSTKAIFKEKKLKFKVINLSYGDVVIFSNTCPHRSKKNKSNFDFVFRICILKKLRPVEIRRLPVLLSPKHL